MHNKKICKSIGDSFAAAAIGHLNWLKTTMFDLQNVIHYDENGMSVLHVAASNKHLNCIKFLVEILNISINLPSKDQLRPLHLMIGNCENSLTCIKYAIKKNADVNCQNESGFTPLHQAAMMGSIESIKLLLRNGSRTDIKDNANHLPEEFAKIWSNKLCARYIASNVWHKKARKKNIELNKLFQKRLNFLNKELEIIKTSKIRKKKIEEFLTWSYNQNKYPHCIFCPEINCEKLVFNNLNSYYNDQKNKNLNNDMYNNIHIKINTSEKAKNYIKYCNLKFNDIERFIERETQTKDKHEYNNIDNLISKRKFQLE
ncbi:hypothetical protein A3Q56_02461 [Intoshia linei]|uniref:Uncharacterized protein n=1 Tax=Intoshia linei TaxID=1819745 RepID=A0A177B7Y7_9BILA|nr:hypothetical protein A3Q56_02461 [Intoshia linei]